MTDEGHDIYRMTDAECRAFVRRCANALWSHAKDFK